MFSLLRQQWKSRKLIPTLEIQDIDVLVILTALANHEYHVLLLKCSEKSVLLHCTKTVNIMK